MSTPDKRDQKPLAELVNELERQRETPGNAPPLEEGTVLNSNGEVIRLGDKLAEVGVVYGDPVALPIGLLSSIKDAE